MKVKVIVAAILFVAATATFSGYAAPHHSTQVGGNGATGVKAIDSGLRFNESDPDTIRARIYFE
jgi:hypothetical protein